ncbi:MAG: hypothetical protein MUC54_04140 [Chloroflexi bacterium]|jgi:uncharacterized protein YtpQ (UPF0354 family)|nr:hypothetical protein [Chloroflexota bacterium]
MDEALGVVHAFDGSQTEPSVGPPPASLAPGHDWTAAASLVYPVLRAAGTAGLWLDEVETPGRFAGDTSRLVAPGPCGLVVAFAMDAGAFQVMVNGDHLASWGVVGATVRERAFANLAAWARTAPWSEDVSGRRRVISSDTGDGWDAARILLPDVGPEIARRLGPLGPGDRILVGLPEGDMLVAGALLADDPEFADLFAAFVLETSGESDEPLDRRVFELVDGRLEAVTAALVPA